jgi:hypothetical protein
MPALALAHEYTAGTVTVVHPWARATPGGTRTGVAFLEIKAAPSAGDKLIAARADVAGRVELHEHIHDGNVMKMREVKAGIPVPAGAAVVLQPSGYHLMMMDLKQPLKEGDLLPITLVFEKAGEIKVEATVEKIGAMGPHGLDAQPGHEQHGKTSGAKAKGHTH